MLFPQKRLPASREAQLHRWLLLVSFKEKSSL